MKNIFWIITISVFFSISLKAQYHAFLEQTDWFMVKVDFGQKSYYWYNTTGDTTINSLDYKIVLRDNMDTYWLREDTVNQKVYIRDAFYQTDFLMYDFSLTAGSSVPIAYPGGGFFTFTCDSVGTVNIMGGLRKRIWVTGTNGGPNTIQMEWVEGLGNYGYLKGLFYLFEQGLQSDPLYQTVCSYKDSVQVFYDSVYAFNQNITCPSNLSTGTMTSIGEVDDLHSEISIFNYTNNRLLIALQDEMIDRVELFDLNGRLLQNVPLEPSYEIELRLEGNLPASIYVLRVYTKMKHVYHKKFIIP
jgi:hypothetical protein